MTTSEANAFKIPGFPTSRVSGGAGFFVRRLYGDNVLPRRCAGCSNRCANPSRICAEQKAADAAR